MERDRETVREKEREKEITSLYHRHGDKLESHRAEKINDTDSLGQYYKTFYPKTFYGHNRKSWSVCHCQSSLIFAGKAGAYPSEAL